MADTRHSIATAYLAYGRGQLSIRSIIRQTPIRGLLGPSLFGLAALIGFAFGPIELGWVSAGCVLGAASATLGNAVRVSRSWPDIASLLDWSAVEAAASQGEPGARRATST